MTLRYPNRSLHLQLLVTMIVGVSLALLAGSTRAERGHRSYEPTTDVLWQDALETHALFLPAGLLKAGPLSEMPLDEGDSSILRTRVNQKQNPEQYRHLFGGQAIPECRGRAPRVENESAGSTLRVTDLVEDVPTVFAGRVLQVVPGWDVWRAQVSELALVQIDELLAAREGTELRANQTVGILFPGGRVAVDEIELCDVAAAGFVRPKVGLRIVAAGYEDWPEDARYFNAIYIFPVSDEGQVQPQPYDDLVQNQSVALSDLKDLFPVSEVWP